MPDLPRGDAYVRCESECFHELVRGVLVGEICSTGDGPFKPFWSPRGSGGPGLLAAIAEASGST